MPNQPKTPFANIRKPTDTQLTAAMRGHTFKRCTSCGATIVPSQTLCWECQRIKELGLRDRVYQPVGTEDTRQDTDQKQSYNAFNRSGYSDSIPKTKIDPTRERF
jgi:hypothetical protein